MEVTMRIHKQEDIRKAVRNRYAQVAVGPSGADTLKQTTLSGCCAQDNTDASEPAFSCGCSPYNNARMVSQQSASQIGYTADDIESAPKGANLGLGCGNPVALAALKTGETVVDLGSGGGFDCFLAGKKVGPTGRVIGVDMTPEMIHKARQNAEKAAATNVEFRLGEIEHMPIADSGADIIISNCVINLSVDKRQVVRDAFRVLKPGGRLAVSDILALKPLPLEVQKDLALISACVGGAATIDDTRAMLEREGFSDIRIDAVKGSRQTIDACIGGGNAGGYVTSAYIRARKPR
jgi:SAM-dependent methyltransferase